jgi:hypothetical protein
VKHLFLDLEDTVITPVLSGWFNTRLINVPKIKSFMAEFKPNFVHLFSFAVWNEQELLRFNMGTRPMLEESLGMPLCTTWTVEGDIIPMCCSVMRLGQGSVSFSDACEFWSKHESFRLCMRHTFKDTHKQGVDTEVVLLDDAVFNEHFHWPDLQITGRVLNIDTL